MITEISAAPHHSRIEKIIEVEGQEIDEIAKSRVKEKLAEDAEYLIEKKRKEQEKKDRVKRMEDNFERQRANKLKQITQKSMKSCAVQQKNKQLLTKKFKQKSDHYKSVISKIEHQNVEDIEKALRQREEMLDDGSRKSMAHSMKDHIMHSKTESLKDRNLDVDYKLLMITEKAKKAQIQHQIQQKHAIERAKQMSKNVHEAQRRAHDLSYRQENDALKTYFERSEEMQKIYHRAKSLNEKKLLEKRRTFKDKIEKCTQNLKQLSYLEQEKFQELQKKFDRKCEPKQWKDHRLERYKQKWEQNTRRLEIEKEEKAEQILMKHQQITQQNRTYKERRDLLLQAIKQAQV